MMDPMMMQDPSMMGMGAGLQGDEGPHPSQMPPQPSTQGGLQPKQEFVSPDLFNTMMSQQMGGVMGMPPAPPTGIQGMMGAPATPPTALQPPVSDMMQSPDLFNAVLQSQQAPPQGQMPGQQAGVPGQLPAKKPAPPQF